MRKEAFEKLDILRITGCVFDKIVAFKRVLIKNGFILEGVVRNGVCKNGMMMDLYCYGLCE